MGGTSVSSGPVENEGRSSKSTVNREDCPPQFGAAEALEPDSIVVLAKSAEGAAAFETRVDRVWIELPEEPVAVTWVLDSTADAGEIAEATVLLICVRPDANWKVDSLECCTIKDSDSEFVEPRR